MDPVSGFVVSSPPAALLSFLTTTRRPRARRKPPVLLFARQQQQQKKRSSNGDASSSSSSSNSAIRGNKRTQQQQQKKRRQSDSRVDATFSIQNEVPRKRDRNQQQKNKSTRSKVQDTLSVSQSVWHLKTPSLAAQLSLARDGHAVLREWLWPTSSILEELRPVLERHCRHHELEAWRQKVEVAADNNHRDAHERARQLAASCQTVADCQKQLHRLLGSDNDDDSTIPLPFLQFFNTWRTVPQVAQLAHALAEHAATLMNVPTVRLYQDAVFWKRAGGSSSNNHHHDADGPTPWHADARLAPFDTSRMVTFWIPLQERVTASGLVFCSQSHSDFALPFWNERPRDDNNNDDINDDNDSPWLHLEERYGGDAALVDYMPLAAGDVTVHAGWTLHCADAVARGHDDRWALAVTLVDARAPVRRDALTSPRGDREDAWSYRDWVHEVVAANTKKTTAGDSYGLWDHPLVPIVWPPSLSNGKRKK